MATLTNRSTSKRFQSRYGNSVNALVAMADMERQPKILVVDDTPQNIRLLEAVLAPRGHRVVTAASGGEALQKIAGEQPDLVLLDIVMPDIDGYEVCRRVRADPATRVL